LLQLQDELDELQRLLEARHGCYGSSLSSVTMTSKAFQLFEKAADVIEGKVRDNTNHQTNLQRKGESNNDNLKHTYQYKFV